MNDSTDSDEDKTSRGTDHAFYQLMQLCGSGILKLLGFPAKKAACYHFDAITLKKTEIAPDMQAMPYFGSDAERVYIEFQAYTNKYIFYRLVAAALLACKLTDYAEQVTIAVIFTEARYQRAAYPLDKAFPHSQINIIQIVLSDYNRETLVTIDPRLEILSPFTQTKHLDKQALQQEITHWAQQVKAVYPDAEQHTALNILGLFLLNRFRNLSYEEVLKMMQFNLLETRAGRDMFDMGKEEGVREIAMSMLEKGMSADVIAEVTGLSKPTIRNLEHTPRNVDMIAKSLLRDGVSITSISKATGLSVEAIQALQQD